MVGAAEESKEPKVKKEPTRVISTIDDQEYLLGILEKQVETQKEILRSLKMSKRGAPNKFDQLLPSDYGQLAITPMSYFKYLITCYKEMVKKPHGEITSRLILKIGRVLVKKDYPHVKNFGTLTSHVNAVKLK